MNIFRVHHIAKNQFLDVEAETFQEACDQCLWPMADCDGKVKTQKGGWAKVSTGEIVEEPSDPAGGEVSLTAEEEAKLDKVVEQTISLPGAPSEAETKGFERRVHIMQLAQGAQSMFLEMGRLLYEVKVDGEWSTMHYESLKEYVEDLKLPMQNSYSWATRLIGIYEYLMLNMNIPELMLAQIGVAKLTRLLPMAREGRLTMDLIEQANILSDLDLRSMLGHNVDGDSEAKPDYVVCPRCGEQFNQKKATHIS